MNITEPAIISLVQGASVSVLVTVVILFALARASSILEGGRRLTEEVNRGKQQDFAAQANVVAAGTEAVRMAMVAMKDAVATMSDGFTQQLAAMRIENRNESEALRERVRAVENDNKSKDARIKQLEDENDAKDARIKQLEDELAKVKKELDAKNSKGKQPGKGNGGAVSVGASE